jgi:pimeloyl-ACP methyl ester carboxylesterase
MENVRKYGEAPFTIAVIHGGPGAPGEMAPVARELSLFNGVLEILHTAQSINGQLKELQTVLENNGDLPVKLIGHSWGAHLSFIFTARHSSCVKKLILVGSPPFEEKYAASIMEDRLSRLNEENRLEVKTVIENLNESDAIDKNASFARLGKLLSLADSYDPLSNNNEIIEYQYNVYRHVWVEAEKLRRSGKVIESGKRIKCPVVAIHGDYDPHPYEGTYTPLSLILKDFRFILLENCGHYPWLERDAKDNFYRILLEELS